MVLPILLAACEEAPSPGLSAPIAIAATESASPLPIAPPACAAPIDVYEAGKKIASVCENDASSAELTVIDLSDGWTPALFAPTGDDPGPPFRETFVALADQRFGDGPEWDRAREDRFLELYGIFPTFRVLRERLSDASRHDCHDAVDDAALGKLERDIDPWGERERMRAEAARVRSLKRSLEPERARRKLSSIDALRGDTKYDIAFSQLDRASVRPNALAAVQAHLRCDRLLAGRSEEGVLDHATTDALKAFQRKQMIVSWSLDAETREALARDSRQTDHDALLRVLRERVMSATGLIEDGSASGEPGLVVGRALDSSAFEPRKGRPIDGESAPDLVSRATDAAATALGWSDPERTLAFFSTLAPEATKSLKIAVRLPPRPAYHSAEMDLRAEIDRGDVWYDFPYTGRGEPMGHPVERRPTLTLYAKHEGREIALVRWPTTIGGWKPEKLRPRHVVLAYKESPIGKRIWRDLWATPVWIPPESAPKRDLVRPRPDGTWTTKQDVFGPGYASAYGLAMLVHHLPNVVKKGADHGDQGIRTHGSASYGSIHRGTSHGCHRLYNHMALRLSSFLLAHRRHVRRGSDPLGYGRSFMWQGKSLKLSFDSRGYRFELDPPVPVDVLGGRIMGKELAPIPAKPLPEPLLEVFVQDRWEG